MKKRFLSLALSAAMVASLAGCGLKSPETTTTAAATEAAATEAATTALLRQLPRLQKTAQLLLMFQTLPVTQR